MESGLKLTGNIPNNNPYRPITSLDSFRWRQPGYFTGPITGFKRKEFNAMRTALLRRYIIYGF